MQRILAIALLAGVMVSIIDPLELTSKIVSVQAQTTNLVTYTEPQLFSVEYPKHWLVEKTATHYFIFWNRFPLRSGGRIAPTDMIKTDITIIDGSLETVSEQVIGEDSTLTGREDLIIGGQDAVRFWFSDSSFDFPDTLITYVRYTDEQTFLIASYYTASHPDSVNIIQQFHGSFRLLK